MGATTLEEAISEVSQPAKVITPILESPLPFNKRGISHDIPANPDLVTSSITNNLDIPAFIRRRARYAG
jgi:hypothetical protein